MRTVPIPIESVLVRHAAPLLRLAGLVSVTSGLIGGYVWLVDLADRSDGDSLRWFSRTLEDQIDRIGFSLPSETKRG